MTPLQHLSHDLASANPYSLVVIVLVTVGTVLTHFKHPEARTDGWKGIVKDTAMALVTILSIFVVQWTLSYTLGKDYEAGGIPLLTIFDFGHLAVAINWLVKCLLRFLP